MPAPTQHVVVIPAARASFRQELSPLAVPAGALRLNPALLKRCEAHFACSRFPVHPSVTGWPRHHHGVQLEHAALLELTGRSTLHSNTHQKCKCACGSWKPNKVQLPNSITQTNRLFSASSVAFINISSPVLIGCFSE